MAHSTRLRGLINQSGIIVCPGTHDALTARAVDRVGFEAIYMTGYGTSLSRAGVPDAGLITMPEMIENAGAIQETVDSPVIADADNGYGNATNVIRTVREYVKTGVAAVHIEDQTFPKRCGHVKGRRVIPKDEAIGKYRAAAAVRDDRDEDFVIIARTDARGAVDGSLDQAIDRANAYCDAGADVAFVEGPVDETEIAQIGREVDAPLLYNTAGISPHLPPDRLSDLGFDIVIYPTFSTRAAVANVYRYASRMAEDPHDAYEAIYDEFGDLPFDMHEFAGFPNVVEWEEEFLPEEDQEKYTDTLGADIVANE